MTDTPVPGAPRAAGSQIAVIDKAVRVLDALLPHPAGLSPTEVAQLVGTNRSTAFRLLTSLEQSGLVSRDSVHGKYYLGMKLLQYGSAVRNNMSIVRLAEPVLHELRDDVRQSALLAVREGWGARCIIRMPGPEVDVLTWATGEWLPLHVAAASQALLSALTDAELDEYLSQIGGDRPPSDGELVAIRERAHQDRDRGWSVNAAELTPGVSSLGAVVRDSRGAAVCAISVAGLAHHYSPAQLPLTAGMVLEAAREIGQRLR